MAHQIEVDDEVYAELERHVKGFEQPNDVLRRLILTDPAQPQPTATPTTRDQRSRLIGAPSRSATGRLAPMLEAGLVQIGDELRCEQVRKGLVFTGSVAGGGLISTEKGFYAAPSPALADLVGTQIDGWRNWIHVPSGKSLDQLRKPLPK